MYCIITEELKKIEVFFFYFKTDKTFISKEKRRILSSKFERPNVATKYRIFEKKLPIRQKMHISVVQVNVESDKKKKSFQYKIRNGD